MNKMRIITISRETIITSLDHEEERIKKDHDHKKSSNNSEAASRV